MVYFEPEATQMYIRLKNLPQILFAHIFETRKYKTQLPKDEDLIEITFIVKGRLTLKQDGVTYCAEQNDVITNLHSSVLLLQSDEPHIHHTICFRVPFELSEQAADRFLFIPLITHTGVNSTKIDRLTAEIIQTHTMHSVSDLTCAGLFLQILDLLHESNKQSGEKILYSNLSYVKKAKTYIYNNLNRPIQQNEIAEYLNISPQYLCSVFRKTEGMPIMTFINKIKLEKIKSLMEKENLKLYQAAEMYGYTNPNYVSKIYKKYFRMNITDIPKNKENLFL